jgi:thioredoxin 1
MSAIAVTEVSDTNFASASASGFVVVDFWAPWCGPCKAIAADFAALAEKFAGKAKFLKVNIDDAPMIASTFQIMSVPTFVLLRAQAVVGRVEGPSAADVTRRVEELAAAAPSAAAPAAAAAAAAAVPVHDSAAIFHHDMPALPPTTCTYLLPYVSNLGRRRRRVIHKHTLLSVFV